MLSINIVFMTAAEIFVLLLVGFIIYQALSPLRLRLERILLKIFSTFSKRNNDVIDVTPTSEKDRKNGRVRYEHTRVPSKIFKSYCNWGSDISLFESTFIRRTIITVAQNTAGQMSLSEVISSKRNELQNNIQKSLSVELDKMGFHLDKVNLRASHLPASLEHQILAKAQAEAEANRLLQATLSTNLIQSKAIDKWDGKLPEVTGGATPIIDLRNFKSSKE